jgi:hypothetical protein
MTLAVKTTTEKITTGVNKMGNGLNNSVRRTAQSVNNGLDGLGERARENIRVAFNNIKIFGNSVRDLALSLVPEQTPAPPKPLEESITLRAGKLELVAAKDQPIQTIVGFRFTSEIKPTKPASSITDTFKYSGPDENGVWKAEGQMPPVAGQFDIAAKISYADGDTKDLKVTTLIDPLGYIYEKTSRGELRIESARVILMQKQGSKWLPWPAQDYNQQNSQITDRTGQYSFLAPAGEYYISVEREGYEPFRSEVLKLDETSPVNINLEMKYLGNPL